MISMSVIRIVSSESSWKLSKDDADELESLNRDILDLKRDVTKDYQEVERTVSQKLAMDTFVREIRGAEKLRPRLRALALRLAKP